MPGVHRAAEPAIGAHEGVIPVFVVPLAAVRTDLPARWTGELDADPATTRARLQQRSAQEFLGWWTIPRQLILGGDASALSWGIHGGGGARLRVCRGDRCATRLAGSATVSADRHATDRRALCPGGWKTASRRAGAPAALPVRCRRAAARRPCGPATSTSPAGQVPRRRSNAICLSPFRPRSPTPRVRRTCRAPMARLSKSSTATPDAGPHRSCRACRRDAG